MRKWINSLAWWVLLAIVVATTVLAAMLAPRAPNAGSSALGDFNAPTAEEGRIIPVIFGTVKISGPNVVWYGDFHTYPIKTRSGLFSTTTTGYRYYLGMQLALCHGPIEAVNELLVGTATAVITVTGTSPFAPNWWAKWTDFILPTLPEDAVVQKIYAVCRASHSVDVPANGAAVATVKFGTPSAAVSVISGSAPDGLLFGQGKALVETAAEYDDLFYVDTAPWSGESLAWIETMAMGASMGNSLFQFNIHDVLLVTGLGFAVYYTSATPTDDSTDLPAPVEIPEGQGVAWSYPDAVEVFVPPPEDHRGTVEATAGVSIEFGTFGVTAGQAPDDIAVPHSVLAVTADKITLRMTAPGLFGGDDRLPTSEGGLEGEVRVYRGTQTQGSDAYLSAQLGVAAPEYKGLCHAVFGACYFGKSNYLKNMNFALRRFPSNLSLPRSVTYIAGDANPAEIIYEAMTNALWGLARPAARFDLNSWQAAAITLASEGMGMSLQWDRDAEAQELIDDILRHIDAVIQTDPATGLWTIKLIRPQAPELELTEDDQTEAPEFTRGSWEETWNDVVLTYTDGATFKPRTVTAQDSANQQVVGAVTSQSLDFLGFTKAAIAQQIAMRELKTHSYPFAKVRVKAKRKAWPLRVGSPFTIAWAPTGITSIQLRVLNIDYGQLEKGMIEIDAVEDAFAVAYSAFDAPQDSAWVDPIIDSESPDAQLLQEAPYEWLESATAEEWILAGATRGDGSSPGFEIWADEGSGYFHGNDGDAFMPSGFLTADYLRTTAALDATGFTLETGRDLNAIQGTDASGRAHGDCLLLFADTGEICAFQTATDNGDETSTLSNIVRGVYDTIPADHPAGTRVFIIRDAGAWFLFPYRVDGGRPIPNILTLGNAGGIPSGEAFGIPTLTNTAQGLSGAGGIPSAEAFGTASLLNLTDAGGIISAEAFGIPSVSVSDAETNLGNAGGIASGEAFGVATISFGQAHLTGAGGIASREAFGIAWVYIEAPVLLGNYTVEPVPCLSQPAGEFKIKLEATIVRSALGTAGYQAREFIIDDPGGVDASIATAKDVAQAYQRVGPDGALGAAFYEFETGAAHGLSTYDKVWAYLAPGDSAYHAGYTGEIKVMTATKFRMGWNPSSNWPVKPWHANTWSKSGDLIFTGNAIMKATVAAFSGGGEPPWNESHGALTYDGGIVWTCLYVGTISGTAALSSSSRIYRGIFRKSNLVYVFGVKLGVLADGAQIVIAGVSNSSFNGTFANLGTTYSINPDFSGQLVFYSQIGSDASSGGGTISANTAKLEQVYFVTVKANRQGDAGGLQEAFCEMNQSKVGLGWYVFMGAIYATHLGGDTLVLPGGWPQSQTWVVN